MRGSRWRGVERSHSCDLSRNGFAPILTKMFSRIVIALLLAVALTLGLGQPPGQADMSAKMTAASSMSGMDHCKQCPDEGGIVKKLDSCSVTCSASLLIPVPAFRPLKLVPLATGTPPEGSLLFGRAFSPDPHPPRYIDIN